MQPRRSITIAYEIAEKINKKNENDCTMRGSHVQGNMKVP